MGDPPPEAPGEPDTAPEGDPQRPPEIPDRTEPDDGGPADEEQPDPDPRTYDPLHRTPEGGREAPGAPEDDRPQAPSVIPPESPEGPEPLPFAPPRGAPNDWLRDIIAKAVDEFADELEKFGDQLVPPGPPEAPDTGYGEDDIVDRIRELLGHAANYALVLALEWLAIRARYFVDWLQRALLGTIAHNFFEYLVDNFIVPELDAWFGPDIALRLEMSFKRGQPPKDNRRRLEEDRAPRGSKGSIRPDVILTTIRDGVEEVLRVFDLKTGKAGIDSNWRQALAITLGIAEDLIEELRPAGPIVDPAPAT
ncbi:hypothetical protein [Gordonia crocea]|nr:hypothetical protein [Gordonia crocea]